MHGRRRHRADPHRPTAVRTGLLHSVTCRMYAQRKQWPLDGVRVHLAYEKGRDRADRITRRIELMGELDDAQRARLLEIADRSPVTRAVRGGTPIIPTPERHHPLPLPAKGHDGHE
ncbi:OsmC family protein [Streptomyces canus]|uniref:OsmC family protein n=1 Tax=Streptomyces canus TaxID=58343 RepID=UPI00380A53DB